MSSTDLPTPAPVPTLAPVQTSNSGSEDSDYTPPATPIFQPSALHPEPIILITLASYTNVPPLQPAPDLNYDLRDFPSPEKHVRSKYDGRTKKLREWLSKEKEYIELLGKVEAEVLARGKQLEVEAEKEKEEAEKLEAEKAMASLSLEPAAEVAAPEVAESAPQSAVDEGEVDTKEDDTEEETEEEAEEETEAKETGTPTADTVELAAEEEEEEAEVKGTAPKNLRVGVSCEMGRHRSVAFIEELSRRKWPVEWAVEVVHRDVGRQRAPRKGKAKSGAHEKGGRRKGVRGGALVNDD